MLVIALLVGLLFMPLAIAMAQMKMSGTVVNADPTKKRLTFRKASDGHSMTVEAAPNLLTGLRPGDQITVTLAGNRAMAISK
jgi:hypothetical protein